MTSTAPRTRPRNRRDQIRSAAATLFYERGYEQVSVADVASSVNIGPSALYRHFSGKADLLYAAIEETVVGFGDMASVIGASDLPGIARTAARTALVYRPLGVLWQREARNLPEPQLHDLRLRLREATGVLAGSLREIRPELLPDQSELLAAAVINAMSSISFHHLQLPEDDFEPTLATMAERILGYRFSSSPLVEAVATPEPAPLHRRDEIAAVAATLFARHGYDAVSVDDIGAAVGMAGPSLYNHFTSKQDLLFASMTHGYGKLHGALSDALETDAGPAAVLRAICDSYVDLTCDHSDLITVLIAEARNLSPEYHDLARSAQLSYIGAWVEVLQQLRPEEDATTARLKVQAAQMMANSVGRTAYLRSLPGFRRDVAEICWLLVT